MRALTAIAAAVVLFATVGPAFAAEPTRLDKIVADKTIRIGTTGDYNPFTYLNPQTNEFEGIDIDLAKSMGKALGVEVKFVKTSWPTLAKDFEADAFDIALGGVSITLDRAKKGYYSTPYLRDGKAAIVRCADKAKYKNLLTDLDKPGVRFIVNPGGTNQRFANANVKRGTVTVYDDNVTIFDQIVQGKADVMITDAVETRLQQKLRPKLCALNPDKPFDFSEKAFWIQRDIALKEWVDVWLRIVLNDGTYQAIWKKFLG